MTTILYFYDLQTLPNQPGAFYPAGLLSTWYPNPSFPTFAPNVIPAENQALFQQPTYKPPGSGRGGNGGPHNQFVKPRRGRGGPGSVSGDRLPNDQRYQNNYQSYQGNNGGQQQQQQPQQQQHYYNNYRGSSRSSWDGNNVKKPYHSNGAEHQQQYLATTAASTGQLPAATAVTSPGQLQQSTVPAQASASAPTLPLTTASSQAAQYPAPVQQNETTSQQQQQQQQQQPMTTPIVSAATSQVSVQQPEASVAQNAITSSAASTVTSSTTSAVTSSAHTSISHSLSGGLKPSRSHEEAASYHGYSGYHQNPKSSMESLHSRDGR